jgi:hypothetical protein
MGEVLHWGTAHLLQVLVPEVDLVLIGLPINFFLS